MNIQEVLQYLAVVSELLRVLECIFILLLLLILLEIDVQRSQKHKSIVNKDFIIIYIRLVVAISCVAIANYVKEYPLFFMFFVLLGALPILTLMVRLMKLLNNENNK